MITKRVTPEKKKAQPCTAVSGQCIFFSLSHSQVMSFFSSALSIDVNRPVKLTISPQLVRKLSKFSDSILGVINSHKQLGTTNDPVYGGQDQVQGPLSELQHTEETPSDVDTRKSVSQNKHTKNEEGVEENSHSSSAQCVEGSNGSSMQVKVKTTQVLVELQLSSRTLDSTEEGESVLGLKGEMMPQRGVASVAEEGLVFVWDHLDLAYPNVTGTVPLYIYTVYLCFDSLSFPSLL